MTDSDPGLVFVGGGWIYGPEIEHLDHIQICGRLRSESSSS